MAITSRVFSHLAETVRKYFSKQRKFRIFLLEKIGCTSAFCAFQLRVEKIEMIVIDLAFSTPFI